MTHEMCRKKHSLDGAFSMLQYSTIAKKIVKKIKYGLARQVFTDITKIIPQHMWRFEEYVQTIGKEMILVPVPLHKSRKKKRGFNQAEVIGEYLSQTYNISMQNALVRVRDTFPQAQIHRRIDRKKNIAGAFKTKDVMSVSGKNILLIDDVFTSGSTAQEAARALKKDGAAKVFLYTLAHGR